MHPTKRPAALVLSVLLAGCVPATPALPGNLVGSPPPQPVATQQPQPLPSASVVQPGPSATPASQGIQATRVVAIFPGGTLQALRSGLRTLAAIDAADLSIADLENLVVARNGQVLPPEQLAFEVPSRDDSGQVVVSFTIHGERLTSADRLTISLPSGKLTLIASGGAVTLTVSSTAAALLADRLASLGQEALVVPPVAVQRLTDKMVSAYLASSPGDPLQSPAFRYAVETMAKALSDGASEGTLATLDLNQPSSGGGGGGGSAGPTNVNGQVNGTNGALTPANTAGATIS